jgi:hypothetical protein
VGRSCAHPAQPLPAWYWPWVCRIDKVPAIVVQPGHLGLVNARDGDPIPVDRILCAAVACDNFQDARKFLSSGGQKGRQPALLTAGLYRINTALLEVRTDGGSNRANAACSPRSAARHYRPAKWPRPQCRAAACVVLPMLCFRSPDTRFERLAQSSSEAQNKTPFTSSSQATDSKGLKNGEQKCVLVLALPELEGSRQSAMRIRALGGCRATVCAQRRTT